METADLAQKAIEFLCKYGGLSDGGDVVFSEPYSDPGYRNPIDGVHPHYKHEFEGYELVFPPSRPSKQGDRVEEDYDGIEKMIGKEQGMDVFYKRIWESIPDDGSFVLIDIGAEFGMNHTLPFAKSHPNTEVVMVDRLGIEDFDEEKHLGYSLFEKKVELSNNPGETMNRLLRANGYKNVKYLHRNLKDSLFNMLYSGKERIVYTGFNNPRNLGLRTIREALNDIYSEFAALSLSRHEQLEREDKGFYVVEGFLRKQGLGDNEVGNYHKLLSHDKVGHCDEDEKYDYKNPGERRFGKVLKLLFNLAFVDLLGKNQYNVEMFPTIRQSYHQPDFMIYASRGRFQLK